MKLLFDWCHLFKNDSDCKLGLDWYAFDKVNGAKLPGSKGLGVVLYFIWWRYSLTLVYDYKSYKARMDYRHSGHLKRVIERLDKDKMEKK